MLDPGPHTTLANWRDAPFNRWSFLHVDRVVPTAAISRGGAPVAPFAVRDGDVLDVPVTRASGYPGRVADVLRDTDTDAFLVLNDGVIVTRVMWTRVTWTRVTWTQVIWTRVT